MEHFSKWFIDFFLKLIKDIGESFSDIFKAIYQLFYPNIKSYIYDFKSASATFTTLDWTLAVISIIIITLLFLGVLIVIFMFLRRYIRFTKEERTKDDLFYEIANLNSQLTMLQDEKNTSLALAGEKDVVVSNSNSHKPQAPVKLEKNRFVKLTRVDEKYRFTVLQTKMDEASKLSLSELVDQFIRFSATQLHLYYNHKTVATFFAGMASSKLLILEGISGTGKTSLPYAMGKFFNRDASIISVQPSWRNRAEMLGYLNEFTKRFNETDFLKVLYEATYRTDVNFIVLDEMNLARIEYYFADFLSMMEMPDPDQWLIDLVPDQLPGDPIHLEDGKLRVSQNIWFVGTANKDDSTFTITDKVYDRAASIEMNRKAEDVVYEEANSINMSFEYLNKLFSEAQKQYEVSKELLDSLSKLDLFITEKFQIAFGNRVMKQIKAFIPVYVACGGTQVDGLDYLVSRKVIRKFETLNIPFMQNEIEELRIIIDKLFGKNNFQECKRMLDTFTKMN